VSRTESDYSAESEGLSVPARPGVTLKDDQPQVAIRVLSVTHALSLSKILKRFPGEKGMDLPASGDEATVVLCEYPQDETELQLLFDAIREWLKAVGLETIDVDWGGQSYKVVASESSHTDVDVGAGTERVQFADDTAKNDAQVRADTTLYWKYEEGPEDAMTPHAEDVGPAWLNAPDGSSQPVNEGHWITRSEARRLASEGEYTLEEDG
jgi:hypothetical protein